MKTFKHTALIAGIGAMALGISVAAQAADAGQNCVRLRDIEETPVIDDKTVLLKMKGKAYKRMDMVTACAGLQHNKSFAYKVKNDELCVYDPVRTIDPIAPGTPCTIEKFVDISETEAKTLLASVKTAERR